MAPEGVAGEGIDEDLHGLAHPDVADLGLLVVGDDVGGHVQHQRDDLHALPDQIPHLYLAGAGMAVARGGDDGVPQVDEGALQLGFRSPKVSLAQLPVGLLEFELALLHPDFGQGFTVAVLGRAQVDLRRVRLTRGDGIALEELLHAGVLAAGQIEAGRRVLRGHAGLPDAGFLQAYLQIETLQIGGVLVPDGPGLVRAGPVVGVLHAQEHVAGLHLLEIAKAHLGHIAVDLGFQHHAVQLGVGVVRLLYALAALQPVEVQQEEEDDEQQHAQDDPRREPEKGQQAVIQGQLQQFVGKTGFEAVHDGPRAFSFPVCPDPRG